MATNTASYNFLLPTVGGDTNLWGGYLNSNWEDVDDLLDGTTAVDGIDINGGSIDGTPIGATTRSTGAFTTLSANGLFTGAAATLSGVLTLSNNFVFDGVTHTGTTGSDVKLVSGTAGSNNELAGWNTDGDAVGSGITASNVVQLTATQTLTNKTLTAPVITAPVIQDGLAVDTETANWTGTEALDPANGLVQEITLTGDVTTLTDDLADGESIILHIDDGTAYTIAWPTITWISGDGSAPTLQPAGDTIITVWKVGTTLYGFASNGA